jgi:Sulfotransferase domain/N-terminal domain of galactosyltransferase
MRIVFCITCKNRTPHLKLTLPSNLADNPKSKFVVLNYGTEDDLLDYLFTQHAADIIKGRLRPYSHFDAPIFRMAHAKNMAHRCGILEGADVLVNLDADNLTGPGFEDFIRQNMRPTRFLWANMIKGEMPRGISGRMVITKGAFLKSGGYDEAKFNGWGSDDKDFNIRLRDLGYHAVEIPPFYLSGISHNDKLRFKEYPHLAEAGDDCFAVNRGTVTRAVVNDGEIGCGFVYAHRGESSLRRLILKPLPTRIFGIGMHKTGTTSLHRALQILGYDSWHWSSAHAAKAIWREMNNEGHSVTLERYHAASDLPMPLLYKQLDLAYPRSKFILTVRSNEEWLGSVRKHFDPVFNQWRPGWDQDPFTHRAHNLLYGRKDFDAQTMIGRYMRHNSEVWRYFKSRPESLVTIEHPRWEVLCNFLDRPIPDTPYPFLNSTPKE